MTQGTKIAIGLGAVAVAGILYVNSKKKKGQQQMAVLAQQKAVSTFAPVDIKPLELKPFSNPFQVKKPLTEDAIFGRVLADILPVNKPILTQNIALPITSTLNRNLVLKFGSKGLEVRELQRLLKVKIDGVFGKQTLLALQNKKRVSAITLKKF